MLSTQCRWRSVCGVLEQQGFVSWGQVMFLTASCRVAAPHYACALHHHACLGQAACIPPIAIHTALLLLLSCENRQHLAS
jgi:hypothetical protein